jgi:hypothetical protein
VRAILLGFYKGPALCRERIALLRALNPGVAVYGMQGNAGDGMSEEDAASLDLDHLWKCEQADPEWCWLHWDLMVSQWYRDVGNGFRFDTLHLIDWDVILLRPLAEIFRDFTEGVVVTDRKPLPLIYDSWAWTSGENRANWLSLRADAAHGASLPDEQLACLGPAMSFSRAFLERYSLENPSEVCCGEPRVPLYAQKFGMPVHDNGLYGALFDVRPPLTCEEVSEAIFAGVRALHPVKHVVGAEVVEAISRRSQCAS